MKRAVAILAVAALAAGVAAQEEKHQRGRIAPPPDVFARLVREQEGGPAEPTYQRGRVAPPEAVYQHLLKQNVERHGLLAQTLPLAAEPEWDSRTKGWIPPVKNQGNCGSCWDFAGVGTVEIAAIKAGALKADQPLSEQQVLDCNRNGGCNGDDATSVLADAKKMGLVFTRDYGPYKAREERCRGGNFTRFQITDWGFVDGGRGYEQVSDTQLTKNAIKAYGAVSCAVCANGSWDGYRGGVHRGRARQCNHAVILVGWKDDKAVPEGGYWIMRNSWGEKWGVEGGYMHIAYGADAIGTQCTFAVVPDTKPPEPPPSPPGPPIHVDWSLVLNVANLIALIGLMAVVLIRQRKG